ncbi:MAG: DUF4202 domain-containing protein [Candidatus Omnitrophica bacterium CG12_big_fil_rev_8_21_14_0_65_45_16]|nr:MAG: DUF4202 domain-containing protein [Candidatus Omnitrophica bacterium CG12_big_fil_rev_8_21_14_0_65_45_16]
MTDRFQTAIYQIDEANRKDPNRESNGRVLQPKEFLYAERMSAWVRRLNPHASEALMLAARAQHICRWVIPRGEYPMTRVGYLEWRTRLKQFHAQQTSAILKEAGYDVETIKRVEALIKKEKLKTDREAQLLEDAACLVFLENGLADFARKHEESKVIDILQKTWQKMSEAGHQAALALAMPPHVRKIVEKALTSQG